MSAACEVLVRTFNRIAPAEQWNPSDLCCSIHFLHGGQVVTDEWEANGPFKLHMESKVDVLGGFGKHNGVGVGDLCGHGVSFSFVLLVCGYGV